MDLCYFDAWACIGPRRAKHPAHGWTLAAVREEMAHCGIAGALVGHTQSVNYDPMHGNLALSRELAPYANLFSVWNVMPHHTGEFPAPEELPALLHAHDVRAVTVNPITNSWEFLSRHHRPLFDLLEREQLLTLIRQDQTGSYRNLEELCERHPRLPLLLTHVHWAQQRYIVPLLQAYRNLHLSFDHFQAHYGLEYLVELGCEDQLLYAGNAPEMSMGAHRTYIDYAEVTDTVKAKIAGGNLRCLLKEQGPTAPVLNPHEDRYMRAARLGQPLPCPVIDMHIHMLHEGLHGGGHSVTMRDGGPSGVARLTQRLGYAGGGIMSWSVVDGDAVGGNAATKAALDVFPAGFWGLGSFDPSHYSPEEMRAQLDAVYADPRFLGVKPYPVFGLRYDDARYEAMWQFANARGLYALIHRTGNDFSELDNLAPRYQNIAWVVAHCGESYAVADLAISCMRRNPNVYLEITLTPVTAGIIDYLVAGAGDDRVVYGSDLPMRDPRQQLGWVVYSRLSEAVKEKVLGGNALRIMESVRKAGLIPSG